MSGETVFTIGHSNRPFDELSAMLVDAGVRTLVDVRRYPRSRFNPQFNNSNFRATLPELGIDYVHAADLGGRRDGDPETDSVNDGWRETAFRNYADYALTRPFGTALEDLELRVGSAPTAIMCAEKDWRQCHRQIIADYLIARDHDVTHLVAPGETEAARITPFAAVRPDRRIHYPKPAPRQGELQFPS